MWNETQENLKWGTHRLQKLWWKPPQLRYFLTKPKKKKTSGRIHQLIKTKQEKLSFFFVFVDSKLRRRNASVRFQSANHSGNPFESQHRRTFSHCFQILCSPGAVRPKNRRLDSKLTRGKQDEQRIISEQVINNQLLLVSSTKESRCH